jgi:cell division protein FtsB
VSDVPNYEARFNRVEGEMGSLRGEVSTLTNDVAGLKADVKGLGGILGRIEQGVLRAQEKSDEKEDRNKPNLIAVVSVLITIISIIVGGAWMIGGALARSDERDKQRDREIQTITDLRNREMDQMHRRLEQLDRQVTTK